LERGIENFEDYQALAKSLQQQQRGTTIHSRFMKPSCQRISTSRGAAYLPKERQFTKDGEDANAAGDPRIKSDETRRRSKVRGQKIKPKVANKQADFEDGGEFAHVNKNIAKRAKQRQGRKSANAILGCGDGAAESRVGIVKMQEMPSKVSPRNDQDSMVLV
jgi:hypothetical protein